MWFTIRYHFNNDLWVYVISLWTFCCFYCVECGLNKLQLFKFIKVSYSVQIGSANALQNMGHILINTEDYLLIFFPTYLKIQLNSKVLFENRAYSLPTFSKAPIIGHAQICPFQQVLQSRGMSTPVGVVTETQWSLVGCQIGEENKHFATTIWMWNSDEGQLIVFATSYLLDRGGYQKLADVCF